MYRIAMGLTAAVLIFGIATADHGKVWQDVRGLFAPDFDEIAARVCEETTKNILRSPASYERVSASVHEVGRGIASVSISFDAMNARGVPLRGHMNCDVTTDMGEHGVPRVSTASIEGKTLTNREVDIYGPAAERKVAGK